MNFIWFLVATFCFYLVYWYLLSMIIFLPSMPLIGFISYLTEHTEKRWTKIALAPTFVVTFIIGTVLPCVVFGMGMGVIALSFAENATHPLVYFLLAGFGAFTISAPSGETSLLGMLISLVTYIIAVAIPKFGLFSEFTIDFLMILVSVGIGLLILIGVVFWIVQLLDRKISKRTETEIEFQQGSGRKLSVGVYILSILFVIFGGLWAINFLLHPARELLGHFIWGAPYLVGGIGMLRRKYWALRFSQVLTILIALQGIVAIPIAIVTAKRFNLFITVVVFFFVFVFCGLPLWFLFKKSTVKQFISRS